MSAPTNPPAYMRPIEEHLFGMTGQMGLIIPYCTCGLVFRATPTVDGKEMRREWVGHVKKVIARTETRDPLSNI